MSLVKLELPCPKSSAVVTSPDPEPHWTWDDLLTELESLELLLGAPPSAVLLPLKQSDCPDLPRGKQMDGSGIRSFTMCISDDDMEEDSESDDETGCYRSLMAGTHFSCNDLDFSDSEESDDELYLETTQFSLMDKKSPEEGILFEFEFEHHLKVKEQVRNKLSALEVYQQNESQRSSSAMFQLENYTEERREMDRRLDMQYQRMIAEVMNTHLSAVQRDHKQRSQIEEQRIRCDAALEEAKRREKALREEELRREKARAEEEARLREAKKAEEAKRAALEAARNASLEAAEKEAARIRESAAAAEVASKEAAERVRAASTETLREMKEDNLIMQATGINVMAADSALKVEANRLKIYDEVAEKYNVAGAAQDFKSYGRKIHILVGQISGTLENVKAKANTLLNILNNPQCPRSISILIFAKKVVSLCDNPTRSFDNIAFACGHIILLLTSQVPDVMDFVLAELHKACIYTVPKHMQPSHRSSHMNDYYKMIGYREEDGKLESSESYFNRVRSYMKLYAALIQTEIEGIRNPHGLKDGWAWLARFLNALPATRTTTVALEAFLKIAGFALYRIYGRQFVKVVNVISLRFLPALKKKDSSEGEVARLEKYIDLKMYKVEPDGLRLRESLLSNEYRV